MTGSYVVLGAAGGIGAEVCRFLLEKGARVHAAVHSLSNIDSISEYDFESIREVDVEDWESVETYTDEVFASDEAVSGMVLCVGSITIKPAHLVRRGEFDQSVSKNLASAFAVVRSGAKRLKTGGSIVLMASAAAQIGLPNHELIGAVKAGVVSLGKNAAATYAKKGVRVNCVAPGLVRTPLSERITNNPASLKFSEAMHPIGRIGEPRDVASAVCWLLDKENSWVTGECISVDGGLATLKQ
ncbi:SDR family oxidoreductase [Puniceicoccaceae bacterium K14]|nr:SDR family oxidoreductase [Puniceicoccaceae bacterium K14]